MTTGLTYEEYKRNGESGYYDAETDLFYVGKRPEPQPAQPEPKAETPATTLREQGEI